VLEQGHNYFLGPSVAPVFRKQLYFGSLHYHETSRALLAKNLRMCVTSHSRLHMRNAILHGMIKTRNFVQYS